MPPPARWTPALLPFSPTWLALALFLAPSLALAGAGDRVDKLVEKEQYDEAVVLATSWLDKHADDADATSVKEALERAAWARAGQLDTVEGWAAYRALVPDSPRAHEAYEHEASRAWDAVAESKNVSAIQAYRETYPKGPKDAAAWLAEAEAAWTPLASVGDMGGIRAYRKAYPSGPHESDALARESDLSWAAAGQADVSTQWVQFAKDYPADKRAADARKRAIAGALKVARAADTAAALRAFVAAFPAAPEAKQVATEILTRWARLTSPCTGGPVPTCTVLPVGTTISAQWEGLPDGPVTASLVAWTAKSGTTQSLAATLGPPAGPLRADEVTALVAQLAGTSPTPTSWTLTLPVDLKRAGGDPMDGYAVQLRAANGATALLPFHVPPMSFGPDYVSKTLGTMKWIPPGTFTMGSSPTKAVAGPDLTLHQVTLTQGYWMMEHEVTQGEWLAVMGGYNPSDSRSCGGARPPLADCPVDSVAWYNAVAFAKAASARDGVTYRLPTEAEWERAARGGAGGTGELDAVAWTGDNSGTTAYRSDRTTYQRDPTTHVVCGKQRNVYGLCDMLGNVWEWTQDLYGDYGSGAVTNPSGPAPGKGSEHVYRGGCMSCSTGEHGTTNVSGRQFAPMGLAFNPFNFGFRLVRSGSSK